MQENDNYYTNDKLKYSDSVRFAGKSNDISSRDISKPLFRPSKSEAVNSDIYINECLEKLLLSSNNILWADLAGCHYSKQPWVNENVKFVPGNINPLDVPQTYPIENFWGCLAQKFYAEGWEAKKKDQLNRRIQSKIKEFDTKFLETIVLGVKVKVRSIGDNGVYLLS